jgi:tetratricopeptide (TPR) repeat protein
LTPALRGTALPPEAGPEPPKPPQPPASATRPTTDPAAKAAAAEALGKEPPPDTARSTGPQLSATDSSGKWRRVSAAHARVFTQEDAASGSHARIPSAKTMAPPVLENLTPEQAYRNGLNFMAAGNVAAAHEAFKRAHEGSPTFAPYLAHWAYTRYVLDPKTIKDVKASLMAILTSAGESEHAALFMGHILSAEAHEKEAHNYYQRCLAINPRNIEALRRVRLYNMRHNDKKQGGFLDRLFKKNKKQTK